MEVKHVWEILPLQTSQGSNESATARKRGPPMRSKTERWGELLQRQWFSEVQEQLLSSRTCISCSWRDWRLYTMRILKVLPSSACCSCFFSPVLVLTITRPFPGLSTDPMMVILTQSPLGCCTSTVLPAALKAWATMPDMFLVALLAITGEGL